MSARIRFRPVGRVIAVVLAALPAAALAQALPARPLAAALDRYGERLATEGVVGGSVLVMGPSGPPIIRTYGESDRAAGRPVDAETIFHWASVTKVFTAIAAMQLVERGQLKLSDPVVAYIPEFRAVHSDHGDIGAVTVEQLLTHSAGLRGASWPWNADGGDRQAWQPHEPTEWSQIAALFPYTALEFAPGSKSSYSNLGLLILGEIVARVAHEPIEIQIEKNILRPLGMNATFFDHTPLRWDSRRTHDYVVDAAGVADQGNRLDSGATAPNGGLNGTLGDMGRFMAALTGRSSESILRAETLRQMLEPRFTVQTDARRTVSMGLGFFIADERDAGGAVHRYFGHSGFQRGNRSAIYMAADGCCAFAFAANTARRESAGGNPSAGALRIDLVDTVFAPLNAKAPLHSKERP